MKVSYPESRRRGRASGLLAPFTSLLQLLGLCLMAGLLTAASRSGDSLGGGTFSDEMVGTLPSFGGGSEGDVGELRQLLGGSLFYIEGPWTLVAQIAYSARGGEPTFEQTDSGDLRALFHGNMSLDVPELTFQDGTLSAGLHLGPQQETLVALLQGGRLISQSVQGLQYLPLPMQHLQDVGVLSGEGLKLLTQVPGGGRSMLSLAQTPGNLHIVQTSH